MGAAGELAEGPSGDTAWGTGCSAAPKVHSGKGEKEFNTALGAK